MRAHNNLTRMAFAILICAASLTGLSVSHGAVVTATGTNPSTCDQTVSDATGVLASRLSGGDCLIRFTSASIDYQWTAPSNLYAVTYLVVGGGGSGGTGWDSTGAAGGGGGMVLTGTLPISSNSTYAISVGAGGAQSTNARGAYNGNNGNSSSFGSVTALGGRFGYASRANSGVAQAGGAAQIGSTSAPTGGSGGGGGTGGGGGGGASGAGGAGSSTAGGSSGAGLSISITDAAVTYGAGGSGGNGGSSTSTGASGGANTGKGGNGGVGGNAASASGGVGGSGVVIIRYSTIALSVNSFALTNSPTVATYKATTPITINVAAASKITFLVNGKRIAGCISIPTSGSGSSHTVTCNWKPTVKGTTVLTALIKPNSPGLASYSTTLTIPVAPRGQFR
jgi:hypothetical protein